jgi:cell division protein FtsB
VNDIRALVEQAEQLAKDRVVRNAEIKRLRDGLTAIVELPDERALLLNAEVRALYEIAKRTLEQPSVLD